MNTFSNARAPWLAGSAVALSSLLGACGGPLFVVKGPADNVAKAPVCVPDRSGKTCDLPGIPFYRVEYRCLHDTQWLGPVSVVTLTVTSATEGTRFQARAVTRLLSYQDLYGQDATVRNVLAAIAANPTTDDFDPFWKLFTDLPDTTIFIGDKELETFAGDTKRFVLAANSITPDRFVDSSTVYYYNGKLPWAGSASAEIDLNTDGSMAKGSSQVESKTAETILSLLPIADVIKSAVGVTASNAAVPPVKKPPPKHVYAYALNLKIDNKVYKVEKIGWKPKGSDNCGAVAGVAGQNGETLQSYSFTDAAAATPSKKADDQKDPKDKPAQK